jgi:4-diphosphocytidyl-2-C-methyl-D-erythritol kinase
LPLPWKRTGNGLRLFPPAKLNLYLEVGPLRSDGYHEIDSVLQTVTLHDELDLEPTTDGKVLLEEVGIAEAERNLVYRAALRLKESGLAAGLDRAGARLRLKKKIPEGAGLGGGSSDAAAALLGLAVLWGIEVRADLHRFAAELGSDVPFFLTGGTCRCRGRGDLVSSWNEAFAAAPPLHYVIVYPRLKVSTRRAYEAIDEERGPHALTAPSPLDSMPPAMARARFGEGQLFFNRFESVVRSLVPELSVMHTAMSEEGFLRVLMTGSGSAMYGVCRGAEEAQGLARVLERKFAGRLPAEVFAVRSGPDANAGFDPEGR